MTQQQTNDSIYKKLMDGGNFLYVMIDSFMGYDFRIYHEEDINDDSDLVTEFMNSPGGILIIYTYKDDKAYYTVNDYYHLKNKIVYDDVNDLINIIICRMKDNLDMASQFLQNYNDYSGLRFKLENNVKLQEENE